jgi:uncharacterized protein YfaS (alpha-2-macroglobulin family)
MKKATAILILILFSQMTQAQDNNSSYKILWEKVKMLENDRLTKSALETVDFIKIKARKEENTSQIVKSLLFSSKYILILEEDAQLTIINEFKSEITQAKAPTKNVLESYLANLYWQFFQQNRYLFYNRTKTEEKVDATDFRTWDLTTLFNEISIHFNASLENSAVLKGESVRDFEEVLNTQDQSEKYRPTLYDLLAHTALDFYTTTETSITRPADKFEINNPEMICEGYQFINQKIATTDATSLQSKALLIYQELLKFHANDKNLDAYVTVDIERLNFIKENATFNSVSDFMLTTLQNSSEHIKNDANWALYQYEIANLYYQLGNSYSPNVNEEYRWKKKEAVAFCETIIAKYPKSVGASKSHNLKNNITQKSLSLTNEKFITVNKPSRILLKYTNITDLEFTAYSINSKQLEELHKIYQDDKQLAFIKKLKTYKTWNDTLKDENDYQSHSIEVVVPELKNGQYVIVARPKNDTTNSFAFSTLQATDMVLVESQSNSEHIFQVIDRENGKPLTDVKLALTYRMNYDNKFITKNFTTDKNGLVTISKSEDDWTEIHIKASNSTDTAYFDNFYINRDYTRTPNKDTQYSSFLFTDRSIYRPGQPLYFKGIAMASKDNSQSVLTDTTVEVRLVDANYQEVKSLSFKTNEYGSFTGEFILPSNGLTGNYQLQVSSKQVRINGSAYFSVEEYKRPKFKASFNPVTETYKVNDTVKVTGTAVAYAGSTISDAKVSYTVKRNVYYPRWYYWSRSYYNNSSNQEIALGETTTDGSGNFTVPFKAIPESGASPANSPTFSYTVTATITDINGETHDTSTTVNVGYHTLTARINSSDVFDKNAKDNKLSVSTSNLNGQFVPAKGTLKMYKLVAPEHVLRNRPWSAPDYKSLSKSEFKKLFPHEAYDAEYDSKNWEKGKLVWSTDFDNGKNSTVELPNTKKWESGAYVIELETKDKFDQLVKDKMITKLFSENDRTLADQQLFTIATDKESYEIGDNVKITLKSAIKDVYVTVAVEKNEKIISTKIIHLENNIKSFTVPVTKEDLGGFALSYSFSAFNAFTSGVAQITVPYPTTDLQIETITFRDKLQPGTEETWSFKIKGPKGDKVTAEILASMYDASLDAFGGSRNNWYLNAISKPRYYSQFRKNANNSYGNKSFDTNWNFNSGYSHSWQGYDSFNWYGLNIGYYIRNQNFSTMRMKRSASPAMLEDSVEMEFDEVSEVIAVNDNATGIANEPAPELNSQVTNETDFDAIAIRENLQETAFFFPQLQTDKEGNINFSFTTPEALTEWKFQLLAHTKNLASSVTHLSTVTQKELMVTPNAPRFLREGDQIVINSKISNLTNKELSGEAKLVLTDVITNKDISTTLASEQLKTFTVDAVGNTQVSWTLTIPENLQAVQYKVIAKAGDYSDGEQNVLPVLSNRMLVTETLPMWVRSNQTKNFSLDKLKNNTSSTLNNHKYTLEITSNPAWYAVQALPYLMEYPYECNEQTFSRYYANTLASHIANSNPRIQEVFNQWANSDALLSNLEKNQELKSLLIQETPWLRDAQSETEQKKRIALLFNMNKMKNEQAAALNKLQQNQMSAGGWSWFAGGRANRYITQHIITGFGHLNKLGVTTTDASTEKMIKNAVKYLDDAFVAEYEYMKEHTENINNNHLTNSQIHYLYMRSFFSNIKTSSKVAKITSYYKGQAQKHWKNNNLYAKGMLALVLHRMDDTKTANKIIRALEENSIVNDELGMYWKENTNSWYWYQAPIETQALLIETFAEIKNDFDTIDNLKIWLLKNKQTNQWKTTKATTEAVYALLLQGSDWLSVTDAVTVLVGGEKIPDTKLENVKVEAGTGYYKTSWVENEITPKMADVQISKKGNGIAWGAVYWQYFEDLDKITTAETPLKLKKKLFKTNNTKTGEELTEITNDTDLKMGDLVRVRIELRADRDMEYIHMKDMRASGLEPVTVFSQYKWQDGLGYYESTKDASTNFFFDYLPKGVYVFEYDLRVNNAGNFSNGITTIQSMYAPEFSSHSEGVRVKVSK